MTTLKNVRSDTNSNQNIQEKPYLLVHVFKEKNGKYLGRAYAKYTNENLIESMLILKETDSFASVDTLYNVNKNKLYNKTG
jgi:hypothetical protein